MKRKKTRQDYQNLFLKKSDSTARSGKTVYIRKEHHDRLLRITQIIGNNEVSLFNYIDNVLEHHLSTYREDISQLYQERISDDIF